MNTNRSETLFEKARGVLPGGVNSPVRAFRAVGGTPRFIKSASGCTLTDVDGNRYVDYVGSWGPMILGHAHPAVVEAVQQAVRDGLSFGAPTERETELAEMVIAAVPSVEKVRFVNSGTEATMSAIRLARGYTGREKIIKFAGCYHGHSDLLLSQAGSGVATFGLPDSPGVPKGAVESTLTAPYNDLDAAESLFEKFSGEIAAVIVEPVAGNMGVVLPQPGFLAGLREITEKHGALLIFDEVITGFRVHYGGAQALFNIQPDLSCFGKIIGGGMPVGCYGGRADIMAHIAPEGPIYQAGTLSGNPLAMAAGIATLRELQEPGTYQKLETLAARFETGMAAAARAAGGAIQQTRIGSMCGLFFTNEKVVDYESAKKSDAEKYKRFFHAMLESGFYFAPSPFEAIFISLAHTEAEIDATISAASVIFSLMERSSNDQDVLFL
jgi:glutamate-1-semialdehyde 2,1-aminomutase